NRRTPSRPNHEAQFDGVVMTVDQIIAVLDATNDRAELIAFLTPLRLPRDCPSLSARGCRTRWWQQHRGFGGEGLRGAAMTREERQERRRLSIGRSTTSSASSFGSTSTLHASFSTWPWMVASRAIGS